MNGFTASDMSTAAANGFRDGLAAQPSAAPDVVNPTDTDSGIDGDWYCERHPWALQGHDSCDGAGLPACARIDMLRHIIRMRDQEIKERDQQYGFLATSVLAQQPAAPGVELTPRPMDCAPRDGTMLRLLVQFDDHATEDTDGPAWTIGANNDDNVGEDERVGWQFAGWCWNHDHFTDGKGTPVGWLPMVDAAPGIDLEPLRALHASLVEQANDAEINALEADSIGLNDAAKRSDVAEKVLRRVADYLKALIDASSKGGSNDFGAMTDLLARWRHNASIESSPNMAGKARREVWVQCLGELEFALQTTSAEVGA